MPQIFSTNFLKLVFYVFKGDYDVVINDYEKAKSLFGKTEVQVFKKCEFSILLNLILILVGKINNMRANSEFLPLLSSFIFCLYSICSIWNTFLNGMAILLPWKYFVLCITRLEASNFQVMFHKVDWLCRCIFNEFKNCSLQFIK